MKGYISVFFCDHRKMISKYDEDTKTYTKLGTCKRCTLDPNLNKAKEDGAILSLNGHKLS